MITNYIIVSLSSIIIGGFSGALIVNKLSDKPATQQIIETTSTKQQEIILQLTDIDLLQVPCSKEFILEKDNLLCREMFCRMMTRGIDSKTGGSECEEISNLANSQSIMDSCIKDPINSEKCFTLYRERK
mgnify:CR=1 FL=1|tara:strand:- start:1046 stop:1435 length:390 start_codon:yes stop_codon:yes gene_type:complete